MKIPNTTSADGKTGAVATQTSTSTDANQRDHDNRDVSVEQSDKDKDQAYGNEVDPHDLDNNVAHTVDSAVEDGMHSAAEDDEEFILTGPIELPPGAYQVRDLNHTPSDLEAPHVDETNIINNDMANNIIESQVVAYTVPDDDEQAGRQIVELQEQLGAALEELDVTRSMPVAEAVPLPPPDDDDQHIAKNKNRMVAIGLVILVTLAIVVGVSVPLTRNNSSDKDDEEQSPKDTDTVQVLPPVLEALEERKVLRCGVNNDPLGYSGFSTFNSETNESVGFEIDLCKAVAAAVFGSSYRYETVIVTPVTRFEQLANGEFDVLIASTTDTFNREVYEASSGMGFSFSTPYLYGGMTFNGVPAFVKCADKLSVVGDCADLRICSIPGTTWNDMTAELFPTNNIVITEDQVNSFENLNEDKCNVIQGEQYEAPEAVARLYGYEGPYAQGINKFTKEPLAMVTRSGDPEFSDLVNWVLQSLFYAEAQNVTMETADTFVETGEVFGEKYTDMFRNALGAVGNYGEIYDRHLQSISPRLKINMLNNGETGLLYSYPLGSITTIGPGPVEDGVIESIIQRGFLRCGTEDTQGTSADERVGLDIEFCKAISASILQRTPDNVLFESYSPDYNGNISQALENGDIDVYAGGQVDMNRDMRRPGSSFSKPYFYINPRGDDPTGGKAFSLVTKEDDAQWTNFVNWVLMSTIYAEENNIVQTTSNEMPLVNLFGPNFERMMRDTILAVGNYGEMYQRVLGQNATRVGRNLLNVPPYGPQVYPLPLSSDNLFD